MTAFGYSCSEKVQSDGAIGCFNMQKITVLLAALALSMSLSPFEARGQLYNSFTADEARNARDKGAVKPLNQIFQQLKKRYGGYQVDANLFNRNGTQVYVIDWVTENGRRMKFTVDAKTGRILSSK
ncbi:MAG: PepSY domain-containing protein [Pseudomonadota bacterium]